ncbi:hypothetical protein BJY52DRAFT_1284881 [Lactarius psammicola]|nr:hypothetical protein BJY52DRAFT_1284881 [Lactarius psammicola]
MPDSRPCFVVHHLRTTTWNDPQRTSASISATATALEPLQSSWEMCMTSTRPIYLVDYNMRTTT